MSLVNVGDVLVEWNGFLNTSGADLVFGETPSGAVNGSNATYTSLQNFVPESVQVFINGVLQVNIVDYTTTGTSTITMNVSPVSGDYIRINYKIG